MQENIKSFLVRLATMEDVDALTDLHCESFQPEEHIPMMLGRNYVKATYQWLVKNSKSYALVADYEGEIVGLVAMCDGSFTLPMFIACLPEFIQSMLLHPSLVFKGKLWARLFRRPDVNNTRSSEIANYPDVAQMTIGAVDPEIRGRSIFPRLISETKVYSKERGSRAIRAGVYKTNTPCRKAFIKDNWVETPELETPDTVFFMAFLDDTIKFELGLRHLAN